MTRYVLFWFVLMIVAVLNGLIRQSTYGRYLPDLAAHQLSTVTGIVLTAVCVAVLCQRWPIESASRAWKIGIAWFLMTVAFEFGFGHYVAGHSWQRLLADYNLAEGRVWAIFLLWVALAPYVFFRLSRTRRRCPLGARSM